MRSEGKIVFLVWLSVFLMVGAMRQATAGNVPSEDSQWPDLKREERAFEEASLQKALHSDQSMIDFFHNLNPLPKDDDKRIRDLLRRGEADKATTQDCGPLAYSLIGTSTVKLTSPNYDGQTTYAQNLHCNYKVTAESGYTLVIDVKVIDLEGQDCKYDYIKICNSQNVELYTICGNTPAIIKVDDHIVHIEFVSDFYMSLTGFWLEISKVLKSVCDPPPLVLNADVTFDSTTSGSAATYKCHPGFTLQGADTITCLLDGSWGNEGTCLEITCAKPIISDAQAIPLYTSTRYRSNMTFTCADRYILKNSNAYLMCTADGSWVGIYPECVNVYCVATPAVSHAVLASATGVYPGDIATYICMDGFSNAGGSKLVCADYGQWVPYSSDINCQPIQCPPAPSAPVNGRVIYQNGTVYTSVVTYACNEGYFLVNVRSTEYSLTCIAAGRWNKDAPKCDVSLCGGLIIKTELSTSGVLVSPNYPDNYSPKRNCTWVIQAPHPGHRITFEVEDMQIEFAEDCIYDRLNLYESNGRTSSKIGTYCGASRPPTIHTLGNFMIVNLYSDDAEVYRGFKASYYFSPARNRNDIQAAALKYYPNVVQKKVTDAKLDYWVEAIAYIRSYKWTVDGMYEHGNCLFLLEAFDGLFHLMDDHILPMLEDYIQATLTKVLYKTNPSNSSMLSLLATLIIRKNMTTLSVDAAVAVEHLRVKVYSIFGHVANGPSQFPSFSVIFDALYKYLMNDVYPQRNVKTALSVANSLVDISDMEVKTLLNIGIWDSPVCPPLVDVVEHLIDAVKETLDELLLLLYHTVVKENILSAFGSEAAHVAEAFHEELTEQLHVLHSPFIVLATAWTRLADIELSRLNHTSNIGVPEHGEGQISEAELLMHSTQPTASGLYEAILEAHLAWVREEFLEKEIVDKIYMMAPSLLDMRMKDVDQDHIEGMLNELMMQIIQHMPGFCVDAKLTALLSGILEVSLLDIIRIELDITNLTSVIATIAQSEFIISVGNQQAFTTEVGDKYRNALHREFGKEVEKLEKEVEKLTGERMATETVPMLTIIKATDTISRSFRDLIRDVIYILLPVMRLNITCPDIDYYAELRPVLLNYVESLQVSNVLDQLVNAAIGSYQFSVGAVAYIREQIKDHYGMVLNRMTGRINQMNIPNHHDLAKQTLIQFILDNMAAQLHQAIDLWKPDVPDVGVSSTQGPLPEISPDNLAQMILGQQASLDALVGQVIVHMQQMIDLLGGGQNACLTYPVICDFTLNYSIRR